MDIHNPSLLQYINKYKRLFTDRISSSLANNNLSGLIIIEDEDPDEGKMIFKDGVKMSDRDFVDLVELILNCREVKEKVELITANIHSREDYLDLLESDCLYDNEFRAVFEALGDIDLAVLGSVIFYEDLRSGEFQLLPEKLIKDMENREPEWQRHYADYLLSLRSEKGKEIERLINKIRIHTGDTYLYG